MVLMVSAIAIAIASNPDSRVLGLVGYFSMGQESFMRTALSGLTLGALYFMVASGLTIIFGLMDVLNFAHGAMFMIGAYIGWQFYTNPTNAAAIKSPEDLCGKNVGASRSTNWPKKIEEWSAANCVAKGKPAIKVVGPEGPADARAQPKSGRLDAGVQGLETLPYFQKLEPNTYVLIGQPFTEDLMGIAFAKKETQLRDAVKGALDRLQAKGVYDQILAKYGLSATKLSPIAVNQGK